MKTSLLWSLWIILKAKQLNVLSALDAANIHVCFLPSNTTDLLQPMDLTVNKPVKVFLRRKFEEWYATKLMSQLEESDIGNVQPINLGLPILKECGAQWLVEAADYISENPQMIVNGFIKAGITKALDRIEESNTDIDMSDSDSTSGSDAISDTDEHDSATESPTVVDNSAIVID